MRNVSPNTLSIVPTLVLYEVYRKISTSISEDQALSVVALMSQQKVMDLTRDVALGAADLSIQYKLPIADSLILAHARHENALLVTLDNDFAKIDGVKVLRKS
jgi:toxin FitB